MWQNVILNKTISKIQELLKEKDSVIIAVDGRCGAGKTTLARELQAKLSCNVIHMDDFFLKPEQRTQERLDIPGENVDHERFLQEVLIPLSKNKECTYRPYNCAKQILGDAVTVQSSRVTIIEGSYSCHNKLWDCYDLHVFMDIDSEEQIKRIILRNGVEAAEIFRNKWIPLEERYFNTYSIKERCEIK